MVAHTAELKDKNDDIVYPLTVAGSVTDTDGIDLQTRVDNGVFVGAGVSGTPSPWVQTSDIVDGAVTATKIDIGTLLDVFYPVGSIYISMDSSFDPNVSFGGTWAKIENGRFIEATETAAQVAANVAAGLPNIKGSYYAARSTYNISSVAGAFTGTSSAGLTRTTGESGAGDATIVFNASNSNAIYSDSVTTVQPKSIKAFIWRRTA